MRTLFFGLVAGLCLISTARADDTCRAALDSFDPVVGTTVTTVAKVAGASSVAVQNKSTTDCYATFGPETLTTTGAVGWVLPGSNYAITRFPYGQNLGAMKLACKAQGVVLHVDRCR